MALTSLPTGTPDFDQQQGISRSLALGRILHWEALMRRRLGEVRTQRYVRLHNYYANQNLPPDNVDQPLMINMCKQIIDKHTSYLWGQYKKHLVEWRVTPKEKDSLTSPQLKAAQKMARAIKRYLDRMFWNENAGNKILWKASKNGNLYGDSIIEVRYDEARRQIVFEPVLPEYFHAMWEISDMDTLKEVIIAYPIDRAAALEQYGTSGNDHFIGYQAINNEYLPGIGILWKRWSTTSFQLWIDETNVVNQPNPYMPEDQHGNLYPGLIPFIHIPCMQAGSEYFGYSSAEGILLLQDELNRRMADMGDIVNTHAHPLITLSNFSGDQNDLPVGPDSIWDLGREGKAERLESAGPGPDSMAYVEMIRQAIFDTASMPQTAFGSAQGGTSHQSGQALAMAMMPVVERAREGRIGWREGLKQMATMGLLIIAVRDPALLVQAGFSYADVLDMDIDPVFADILPKEELQEVNEAVATYANGVRSLEKTLVNLGVEDVAEEIARIKADMLFKASVEKPVPPASGGSAGKNSTQGQGGSADLPGGIGANAGKPGTLIKSPDLDKVDDVGLGSTL